MGSPAQTGTNHETKISRRNTNHAAADGRDPRPIPPNTKGTVAAVDDIGTLFVDFDNGRSLGVVPGEDSFRTLTDEEFAEEQSVCESEAPTMGM